MTVRNTLGRPWAMRFIIVLSLFFHAALQAKTITLAWAPSPSDGVAGYKVAYGLASGQYTASVDAGMETMAMVPSLLEGNTYYLTVLAYDDAGNTSPFSNEIIYAVPGDAPQIVSSSGDQMVGAGSNAVFSVVAVSATDVTYQWFCGSTSLADATNAVLTLPGVSDASAGSYTVVVSNNFATVSSAAAVLTVCDPPVIWIQPTSQTQAAGENVTLGTWSMGTGPLLYQWYHNGVPILGANAPVLSFFPAMATDAGAYYATVQNAAGSATTLSVTLTLTGIFLPLSGTYNGLFYQTAGNTPSVDESSAGLFGNCIVDPSGIYTAKVCLGGLNYSLFGILDGSGNNNTTLSRAAMGFSDLSVNLHLDMSGVTQMITGSISNMDANNPWTAMLAADFAATSPAIPAGSFLMRIPHPAGIFQNAPRGYASVVNLGGTVMIAGVLSDGSQIVQTVPVSKDGLVPLYISLYGGSGLMEGWLNMASGTPKGWLTWIRPTGANTVIPSPGGFTNTVELN